MPTSHSSAVAAIRRPAAQPVVPVLRRFQPSDLAGIQKWDDDPELLALYGAPPSRLLGEDPRYLFVIEFRRRVIGLIGLSGASTVMRSGELEVVIGRVADRGRGLGRQAVLQFVDRIFSTTPIDLIYLRVLRGNHRAVRCFEHCGFRRQGLLRVKLDPRYSTPPLVDDVILMTRRLG